MRSWRAGTWMLVIACGIVLLAIGLYVAARRATPDTRIYRIGWENDPPFQVALADGSPGGLATEVVKEAARRRNIRLKWVRLQRAGIVSLLNRQVDLWPLMTITEERKLRIHISEPYLEHGFIYLVRQDSPYHQAEDLRQRTLSHLNQAIVVDLARKHLPQARLVSRPTVTDAIVEVCQGHVDGAFLEENAALTALLDGSPCAGIPLRSVWEPSIQTNLSVASTFEAAHIADEIRAEIGNIATEGRLSSMASRWGDFSVRNTETIHLLQAARQRERNLFAATLVFAFLLLLATWQTLRHRRETKRARRAEQMLRETEQKVRLMANNLSEIVLAYGMDRKLVFANPAVEELTGHPLAELEARGFCAWMHTDDQPRMMACFNGLFEGRAFRNEEFRLVAGDGRMKWMVANCGPILDDTGRQVGVQGSVQDVTERKLASELLRQSEERFRLIADTLPSLVWTARPDGALDYVNRVFRDYAGGYGNDYAWTHAVVHPDDLQLTREHWESAVRSARPYRMEHRLRRHDGIYRWHLSCGVPALDSGGHVLQWCGTSADIHELRLRESEERFREIADTAPVIVWITGADGFHTFFNRQAVTFTGRKVDDLLGHTWMELIHPDDREVVVREHAAASQAGRDFQLELRLRRDDQTYRWMLGTGTARWENGAYAGHVGTMVDITDLKRNQEEMIVTQKLESLGVLAAGIAHDFNNLLGSILLDSESILTEADAGIAVRETAQRIEAVAIRASEIVRQLLAFAGKGQTPHAPFNASQLAGEMVSLLKASISKRALVETELTTEPLMVHGSATQFQQVIMNLITNASESLGEGEGTVTVRTCLMQVGSEAASNGAQSLPEGSYVRLEVIDTGCGMSDQVKSRIFDPFYTTKFSGRGLGLAAVPGIIRSHGGTLRVESTPGRGSRFEILLPCTSEVSQPESNGTAAVLPGLRNGVSGAAMVIEDEHSLRIAVSKSLRRKGFSVIEAGDGHSAIHLFRTTPDIDVVLLDMTLPGMSGIEVLAELRKIRPDVKVILTTAYSREMAMSSVGEQRISDFIRKPYPMAELLAMLQKVISARAEEELRQ
jgi:PAS domain S-box-containing protein